MLDYLLGDGCIVSKYSRKLQKIDIRNIFITWILILMKQDEQIKQHREKWKMWNEQRQRDQVKKKLNVEAGIENYATNLIMKMSENSNKNNEKQAKQLTKKINSQIQSNICSICLDLMIPPDKQPIILFPCGHNICKDCLFQRPPQGLIKKNLKLKLQKCALCRQKIESYALNQSLMALICTYSNNKELLEQEQRRLEEAEREDMPQTDFEQLRIRCNILQDEKNKLSKESERYAKQKDIIAGAIDHLKREKRNNQKQMERLEEQAKLISKFLTEKVQQMQLLQKQLKDIQDKERVVDKALVPLKKQKQKQELLQLARLLKKN